MRYLVATDGSEEADDAVRYAAKQAVGLDAELNIAHVLAPRAEFVDGDIVFPGGDEAVEMGERTLSQAQRLASSVAGDHGEDLPIKTQLLSGRPANAITDYAREIDADAIYVGHRGLSEKKEKVTGSVAKSVVDNANVPVTVIR